MKTTSKLEERFAKEFLDPLKLKYEPQYRIGIFVFDFFVPAYNTLIEIHGGYWHADKRLYPDQTKLNAMQKRNQIRDANKSKSAAHLGFKLLTLWEGDIIYNRQSVEEALDEAFP